MSSNNFEQLKAALASGGAAFALETLISHLREQKDYHALFEALKMKSRLDLGLSVTYDDSGDELEEALQQQLEQRLIDACREVGTALLDAGQVQQGWMYMRIVGDKEMVAKKLSEIDVHDENMEEFIEVALHEGVAPELGFAAVLNHYGTCNAITTCENVMHGLSVEGQQAITRQIVQHLHEELLATVVSDITEREGKEPTEKTLRELLANRETLLDENTYHVDTTHLASVVRFARLATDEQTQRTALDLTEYGRRLDEQFQYPDTEPFVDVYPASALLFQAILGEKVDEAVAFFKQQAEKVDVYTEGSAAVEVYISLLARLQRYDEAVDVTIELIPPGTQTYGFAPTLVQLTESSGNYEKLLEYCQQRDDLLGYTVSLLQAKSAQPDG
jgi:hypothetical protein